MGIEKVFRVGGAQAIAAMAYGTETIPRVDVICGPGNAYVMEAKRQVYGSVGIDNLAGPSEVLVVADRTARPDVDRGRPAGPGGARQRGAGRAGGRLGRAGRGRWLTPSRVYAGRRSASASKAERITGPTIARLWAFYPRAG